MNFNEHYKLKGAHAFLSASSYHWLRYSEEKLIDRYMSHQEAARGSALHAYAEMAIRLKRKQPRNNQTLNRYINDAIGYRMETEQILFYSENAFGTVDAISFRDNLLRIHDLKNGVTPANMDQLRIYAAFFCLEYDEDPKEIDIELRIYQSDEIIFEVADPEEIREIMTRIKIFDKIIEQIKEDALL